MMMKKRMIAIGAVCVILIGLLCGCGKKSMMEKRIVGEWFAQSVEDVPDSNEIYFDDSEWAVMLEFCEDGTCSMSLICVSDWSYEEYDIEYGTYYLEDEETIRFEWDSDDEEEVLKIAYNKGSNRDEDTFMLTDESMEGGYFCAHDFMMKT